MADWKFKIVPTYGVRGRNTSEDNFAVEERTSLQILIRESLQNSLDARAGDNTGAVKVRISLLKPGAFDGTYLAKLITPEYRERLASLSGHYLPVADNASVLVLEDFGTTGLEGTWNDGHVDGPTENWNAFWFSEGEGAKSTRGSNGSAGQGKVTYYHISDARAVFALTVRHTDRSSLMMGRSVFTRDYPYADTKFERYAFWCCGPGDDRLPETSVREQEEFLRAFGLKRKDSPGLSLVIPYLSSEFNLHEALVTVLTEFYYPILRGRLEVTLDGISLDAGNVERIAEDRLTDDEVHQNRSSFTGGFRNLVRYAIDNEESDARVELVSPLKNMSEFSLESFPEGAVEVLRDRLDRGEIISIRCPLFISRKPSAEMRTQFDIYIQVPDILEREELAYIRRDLVIGLERPRPANLQRVRVLTLIKDDQLSAFLADAEEPTHLKWNSKRPQLAANYRNPDRALSIVRNAAARILLLLTKSQGQRDVKVLAQYFKRPAVEGKATQSGGAALGQKSPAPPREFPVPVPRPFRIDVDTHSIRVLPNGSHAPDVKDLPVSCVLELAYEGLDQNPFKAYDPFDFDLADMPVSFFGVQVISKKNNRLKFDIVELRFLVEATGFDPNLRLRARLSYTEKKNEEPDNEE